MKMKKILAAVLAGVMALSATACSSSSTKKRMQQLQYKED